MADTGEETGFIDILTNEQLKAGDSAGYLTSSSRSC